MALDTPSSAPTNITGTSITLSLSAKNLWLHLIMDQTNGPYQTPNPNLFVC